MKNSNLSNHVYVQLVNYEKVIPIDEDSLVIKDYVCDFFGCNKILSITEKLCGRKCIEHMGDKLTLVGLEQKK